MRPDSAFVSAQASKQLLRRWVGGKRLKFQERRTDRDLPAVLVNVDANEDVFAFEVEFLQLFKIVGLRGKLVFSILVGVGVVAGPFMG